MYTEKIIKLKISILILLAKIFDFSVINEPIKMLINIQKKEFFPKS